MEEKPKVILKVQIKLTVTFLQTGSFGRKLRSSGSSTPEPLAVVGWIRAPFESDIPLRSITAVCLNQEQLTRALTNFRASLESGTTANTK